MSYDLSEVKALIEAIKEAIRLRNPPKDLGNAQPK